MEHVIGSAADVGCVLGSECGEEGRAVGSPDALELVERDGEGMSGFVCVGVGVGVRLGRLVQDKVNQGSDASATKGNSTGLCRGHGSVNVGFVL